MCNSAHQVCEDVWSVYGDSYHCCELVKPVILLMLSRIGKLWMSSNWCIKKYLCKAQPWLPLTETDGRV
jgi:hypothetical protein